MLQESEIPVHGGYANVTVDSRTEEEVDCYLRFLQKTYPSRTNGQVRFCNSTWDGISCWPTSPAGTLVGVPCFEELNGVRYDTNTNASRRCLENGTWDAWSNYRSCEPLKLPDVDLMKALWDVKEAHTVYCVGYGVSLVAIVLALLVFLRFKDLRCLRNTIHTNLMVTYLLIDITWILTAMLQSNHSPTAAKQAACFMVILLTYLMGTNFFWMFVEGLYLYMLVVKTFSIDKIQFKTYLGIGWGVPALVAAAWAIVKATVSVSEEPLAQRSCPWQNKDHVDFIFICPVILILSVNIFFLAKIMWVLITKLRASNTVESNQYRKAAKALLVLLPLLGVTYLVVIATPSDPMAEIVFTYIQATLMSIQGFMVAVLYCFLNGEVQNSLRHHFERWKTQNTIGKNPRHSVSHLSPRHGETLPLYGSKAVSSSCTSFTTTTSIVNVPNRSPNAQRNGSPNLLGVQDDMV